MKKVISLILAVVLVASCCIVAGAQQDDTPVIFIPGFLEPKMCINVDKDNEEQLFPPTFTKIAGRIITDSPNFITSIIGFLFGDAEALGASIGGGANYVCEKMKCNPDGSSKYELETYPADPAICNMKYLSSHKNGSYIVLNKLAEDVADKFNPERVFIFNYDCRYDSLIISTKLRQFIKDVKQYTGASKVRLCSHSYGGQIIAAYFWQYKSDADVKKAVMIYPALEGTGTCNNIMRQKADIPLDQLAIMAESFLSLPTEIARLLEAGDFTTLNRIATGALDGMGSVTTYWGSMYSLCSPEFYDALRDDLLDPETSPEIIKNNDIIHHQMMPGLTKLFAECQADGVELSIISGSGRQEFLGGTDNADILLPVPLVSGATCAKLGERFADGYTAKGTVCSDPNHNHVSPSMEIDASTAYLPENTWFIDGAFHGVYMEDPYEMDLIEKLLLTDDIKDVRSDKNFPQFEYSHNVNMGVHFSFDSSSAGYITNNDSALIVTNLNNLVPVKVLSVTAYGADIKFDASLSTIVAPGSSVSIPFTGSLPEKGAVRADITVNYAEGAQLASVTHGFTINNGPAAGSTDTVDNHSPSPLEEALGEGFYSLITKLKLRQIFDCLYSTIICLLGK